MTQRCRDIIVGCVFGDGCLERNGRNVRLRVDHGEAQRGLVGWKFHELAELSPSRPRRVEAFDRRTGRVYVHYRFATRTVPELNEFFDLFYGCGAGKAVPADITTHLTSALSVAVWYMDDGGRRSDCRSGYFNTQSFSADDVNRLRECLRVNFGLTTALHFAAGRPRIYVAQPQFVKFCDLVRPFVTPDTRYKLL